MSKMCRTAGGSPRRKRIFRPSRLFWRPSGDANGCERTISVSKMRRAAGDALMQRRRHFFLDHGSAAAPADGSGSTSLIRKIGCHTCQHDHPNEINMLRQLQTRKKI
jgi:hypothetical protein